MKPPENCNPPCHTATTSSGLSIWSGWVSTQVSRAPTTPAMTSRVARPKVSSALTPHRSPSRAPSMAPAITPTATSSPNDRRLTGPTSIWGNVVYGMAASTRQSWRLGGGIDGR